MRYTYFAFGSNMSLDQMLQRCPEAEPAGIARLPGYRLLFSGFSRAWGGAVATVVKAPGSYVPGLLYRLTEADLARLDAFEGAPFVYERRRRRVRDATEAVRVAHVYGLAEMGWPGVPSAEYFRTIHAAYRKHRFDVQPLSSALAFTRKEPQCQAS